MKKMKLHTEEGNILTFVGGCITLPGQDLHNNSNDLIKTCSEANCGKNSIREFAMRRT